MRLHASLVRSVVLSLAASAAIALRIVWTFPLSRPSLRAFAVALAVAAALGCVAAIAAALRLGRPVAAALADPGSAAAVAARAAQALPGWIAAAVLGVHGAAIGVAVASARRTGLPLDLAAAAGAVGVATALLAAMLAFSVAARASASASERLGARADVAARGTVRLEAVVVGFALGLATVGVFLLTPAGYVRHRAAADRAYVAAAARAQAAALASAAAADPRRAADAVHRATGAPVAALDAGGALLARFGDADAPLDGAAAGPDAVPVAGGWILAAGVPGGAVASFLPDAPLAEDRRAWWASAAETAVVAYLAAALLAWVAAGAIAVPLRALGRAAARIGAGDLTASPPSSSPDEMGRLAADFRRMAQGLKALVGDVRAATEGVSEGAREAGALGARVRTGVVSQQSGVLEVQRAVETMDASVAQVSRGAGGLSEYLAETTHAVAELGASYEAVRAKGAELERAMDAALHDVEHLGVAGRDAEAALGDLDALAGQAGGSLVGVKATVAGLGRAAEESEATAASIADLASGAGGVVEETVHGIEALRAAVADAHRRISVLGRRSDDVDQVVDFISEVAGRTNLLSLNASIIAAQAGEHGKAFAVVADQIRELAAQIARSTKSIEDIIHAVREDVEATAALIDRGDALAAEGVQLARNSLEAISRIQRSTAHGRETAAAIRAAVDAHGRSARDIAELVASVADGSRSVAQAVQLVGRSVAGVHTVARTARTLTDGLARALDEQSGAGKRQSESLGRLERLTQDLTRAVETHESAARRVRDALERLALHAGSHDDAVAGLAGASDQLGARAKALAERVDRFKV